MLWGLTTTYFLNNFSPPGKWLIRPTTRTSAHWKDFLSLVTCRPALSQSVVQNLSLLPWTHCTNWPFHWINACPFFLLCSCLQGLSMRLKEWAEGKVPSNTGRCLGIWVTCMWLACSCRACYAQFQICQFHRNSRLLQGSSHLMSGWFWQNEAREENSGLWSLDGSGSDALVCCAYCKIHTVSVLQPESFTLYGQNDRVAGPIAWTCSFLQNSVLFLSSLNDEKFLCHTVTGFKQYFQFQSLQIFTKCDEVGFVFVFNCGRRCKM